MGYNAGNFDVAVIGAGHAGIEAALASARLGCKTIIFTINNDAVGNCPCNPSIGGTAKGHLVREIDALGGEMGKTADECFLQMRMLNRGKGPAVHSLRAQIDRRKYADTMKHKIELQKNLILRQAEITELDRDEDGTWKLTTRMDAIFTAKAVVIATGTYLGGRIFVGETSYESGPDGIFPAKFLGSSLKNLGLKLRRFKTGTPARVLKSSIDFSDLEVQEGDVPPVPFSYDTESLGDNKVVCHISWTNEKTKEIILNNIQRSPLYAGKIEGVGPRYCPSIEDKIVRFSNKQRHQLFIEPCGLETEEMYLQGMSSSLPEEVQTEFYHSIKGLENVVIMRPAYAIEYDCIDPTQMDNTLEFRDFSGLYGAGQFNGSSGYEEAAAQGLLAGINAGLYVKGQKPWFPRRNEAYVGVLMDDLCTLGTKEPYRMFTSRAEYRLILREDNADIRLTPKARELGIISDERWKQFEDKQNQIEKEKARLRETSVKPSSDMGKNISEILNTPLSQEQTLEEILRRPEVKLNGLIEASKLEPIATKEQSVEQVEIQVKYQGYLQRELDDIKKKVVNELTLLPMNFDYKQIKSLSNEVAQKLNEYKPETIGMASRISGITPAAISILLVHLKKMNLLGKN